MTYLLHKKRCSDPCFPIYDPRTFILLCFKCSPTLEKSRWVIKWAHFHLTDILLKFSIKIIRSTWNYHFRRQQNSVPIVHRTKSLFLPRIDSLKCHYKALLQSWCSFNSFISMKKNLLRNDIFVQENQHPRLFRRAKRSRISAL